MSSQALIFELNEKSFAQAALLNSHKAPVLVEFMGVWSGPCIALESRLTELAQEFPEQFVFAKVDIDEQPALRKQYRIENVPTLVVFRDGKPVRTEVGELSADDLRVLLRDFGVFRPSDEMREQARARHVAGDTAAAVQLLGEAARSDPGNTRIALDMVQIMIDVGHLDDARSLFERLPEAIRESDAGNALKGQLAFADLAAKTAGIGALQARLAAAPEDHDARFDLAICEVARHDFDAAMEALFHVQARDPAFRDGAAREMIVALINMLTANHPESAAEYRRRLANLLSE
ncbi:MAG: tetratricopeptide repeat protein [Gammaproteobacteria bacterium]|nr:tetratricopeptide repeat protein [Gammaproteobacteria bacterium]MCP5137388.1 tetratricopeptide repeat protein [Gammaproteobacteria bacterium]